MQHIRHIISKIHHTVIPELIIYHNRIPVKVLALGIIRQIRHQHIIAHLIAVDIKLKETQTAHKSLRFLHRTLDFKPLAQQRRRRSIRSRQFTRLLALPRRTYPFGRRPDTVRQTYTPVPRLAPAFRKALAVSHRHHPVAIATGSRCLARIRNKITRSRLDITTVP